MALPGKRLRANDAFGSISDNPLTAGSATFNSTQLVYIPVVSGDHLVITLDPLRQFGDPEIVVVTNHSGAATVATVTRGAYGTTARSHPQGTIWVHAAVDEDFMGVVNFGSRPSNPYTGQKIYEPLTDRYYGFSTSGAWQQEGLFFDPPACRIFNNANISINDATETTISFNSERYDTDGMHDNVTNNSRITFNKAGIYEIQLQVELTPAADYVVMVLVIRLNGVTNLTTADFYGGALAARWQCGTTYKFAVNDFVEARVYHDNTANVPRNVIFNANNSPEFMATWIGRGN